MILGKWHAENDSTFVWEFYENGQHFTYSDDELIRERSWEIVNECEGEAADNKEDFAIFVKTTISIAWYLSGPGLLL